MLSPVYLSTRPATAPAACVGRTVPCCKGKQSSAGQGPSSTPKPVQGAPRSPLPCLCTPSPGHCLSPPCLAPCVALGSTPHLPGWLLPAPRVAGRAVPGGAGASLLHLPPRRCDSRRGSPVGLRGACPGGSCNALQVQPALGRGPVHGLGGGEGPPGGIATGEGHP